MKYTLEYFDNTLQKQVIEPLEADTVEKARRATYKILQDKDYEDPNLYSANDEVAHAYK